MSCTSHRTLSSRVKNMEMSTLPKALLLMLFLLVSTTYSVLPGLAANDPFFDFSFNCDGAIDRVAYSSDGKCIAAAKSFEILLWKTESGVPVRYRLSGGLSRYITAMAFSANGDLLAAGDSLAQIFVWDVRTGNRLHRFKFSDKAYRDIGSITFSPDGRLLAAGEGGGATEILGKPVWNEIHVWDLAVDKMVCGVKGATNSVCCLAFEPDGRRLVSVGCDGAIKTWEPNSILRSPQTAADSITYSEISTIRLHDSFSIGSLSVDCRRLVVTGEEFEQDGEYPDGDVNLEVGRPNTIRFPSVKVFDITSGKFLTKIQFSEPVREVVFTPDGRNLVAACGSRIEVRDSQSGVLIQSFTRAESSIHNSVFSSVATSPSGDRIVAGNLDKVVRVFERPSHSN